MSTLVDTSTPPAEASIQTALEDFYDRNDYGEDGGANARWVRAVLKPFPIVLYFPNFEARRSALRLHDIHHLATGYETDMTGEAEIAAWEIGGSCTTYWAAWFFNSMAFCYGWIVLPRRVFRAFVRGRHTRNLYREPWRDEFLTFSVDRMRHHLELDRATLPVRASDVAHYVACVALAVLPVVVVIVAALVLLMMVLPGGSVEPGSSSPGAT